tara:strand:+ start:3674 stop:4360 length:687 start_codon:yes stop_codon:yes gene_type:complete
VSKRVLVVEDEPDLRSTLEFNLKSENYKVTTVSDGESALAEISKNIPDLILLDLMLPDMSGLEICKKIRGESFSDKVSIIMLTAKGEEVDRVVGFELGADDYVVKPFSVRELMLRVSSILKRSKEKASNDEKIVIGDIEINLASHRVFISGIEVELTAKEFELLKYLTERNGRIQTRESLLEHVWGYNNSVTTRTVDTHIKRLRSKIGEVGTRIETVRGVGYRFNYVV